MDKLNETAVSNSAQLIVGPGTNITALEMMESTRTLLEDFYRPWNAKLAELLGDERFLFTKQQESAEWR